jgi:hypothetical protein
VIRRSPLVALAAAALVLTGCTAGGQAVTVGDAPKSTQSAAPVDLGAKGPLTQEEAEAALPTAEQLGGDWADGAAADEAQEQAEESTFNPEQCSFSTDGSLAGLQMVEDGVKPVAEAKADFHVPAKEDFSLDMKAAAVSIQSYADPIDASNVERIAARLEECAEFTSTSADGVTTKFEIFPISLPNYGDETLAFRLQGSVSFFVILADAVQVVAGHNVVSVGQLGRNEVDTELAGELAATVMENLDTVTAAS